MISPFLLLIQVILTKKDQASISQMTLALIITLPSISTKQFSVLTLTFISPQSQVHITQPSTSQIHV